MPPKIKQNTDSVQSSCFCVECTRLNVAATFFKFFLRTSKLKSTNMKANCKALLDNKGSLNNQRDKIKIAHLLCRLKCIPYNLLTYQNNLLNTYPVRRDK